MSRFDDLEAQVDAVEGSLSRATSVAAAFEGQLDELRVTFEETGNYLGKLETGFSGGLRKAFDGLVLDGMKLTDALRTVAQTMVDTAYSAAVKPVTDHFGGLLAQGVNAFVTGNGFAKGGAFQAGQVTPFAKGGVISGATNFPMRGGMGLMGEAGPEAIMPLTRGADGSLGVRAQGGGTTHVTMNISTPDAQSFQRSQSQIATRLSRAISRAGRNS